MAKVDLSSAQPVSPTLGDKVEVSELRGLPKAGVDLAKRVLTIACVFVAIAVIWVGISEFGYAQWLHHPSALPPGTDAAVVIKEQAAFREFWLKIFQVVLLNMLLPVLTAVLGYTFGSQSTGRDSTREK